MIKHNQKLLMLAAIASIGLSATSAFADDIVIDTTKAGEIPYVIDGRNVVARSGFDLCWHTGYWTPEAAEAVGAYGCDPDLVAKPAEEVTEAEPEAEPVVVAEDYRPAVNLRPTEQIRLPADFLFDFNKDTLKPEGRAVLDDLAYKASDLDLEVAVVKGYTDYLGSDAYNQKLSVRRANTVRSYLVAKGISSDRITTEGLGEADPVTGGEHGECANIKNRKALIECLARDRRVEIELIGLPKAY